MKKLLIPLALCLFSLCCFPQNPIPIPNTDEITVSPPTFIGSEFQNLSNDMILRRYILKHIDYPLNPERCIIEGQSVVEIEVEKSGNVGKIEFISSLCPEIDKEIERVILSTNGMWKPGLNNDKAVVMPKVISIAFTNSKSSSVNTQKVFKEKAIYCFKAGSKKLYNKQNPQKALHYFNRGLRYMPYDQGLLLSRGLCLYEIGDIDGAYKDWNRVTMQGGVDLKTLSVKSAGLKGEKALAELLHR